MRVLSGIKPSGKPHLGNYFGAMQKYLAYQEKGEECFFFLADWHALTSIHDAKLLREYSLEVALSFLSIGLNPDKVVLFRHSKIRAITELAWILSCLCPLGMLERCHAYKDAVSKKKSVNHGLFAYPVLMAADILIYKSDLVPVGRDQKQHVEVARDLALSFNNRFEEVFPLPEAHIEKEQETMIGIDGRKMSKSYQNTIELFAPEKEIKKKIMSIKTDSIPLGQPLDPDNCLVFYWHRMLGNPDLESLREKYQSGQIGYGDSKKKLLELFLEKFKSPREKRKELEENLDYVTQVLEKGAQKARKEAEETIDQVRKAVGLSRD